jgi:hypothetical protein
VYAGKVPNPGWLTTKSIYQFFGARTLHSLQAAYRQELEQMAALGQWETDWRDSIKATILLGSDKFIKEMLRVVKGNRREQTGLRLRERLREISPKRS